MREVFCTCERRKTSNVEDARHDGTLLEWGMFRMERADAEMPRSGQGQVFLLAQPYLRF
jgi:hypothetical protein